MVLGYLTARLGAMELRIVKPSFKYTAGQWLFIQIPELSHFQWHPVRYHPSHHSPLLLFYSPMAPGTDIVVLVSLFSSPSRLRLKTPMFLCISVKLATSRRPSVSASALARPLSPP